jgi:hypothetical protein
VYEKKHGARDVHTQTHEHARAAPQVKLCFIALSIVPVLAALIAWSWQRYGATISRRGPRRKPETPLTGALRKTISRKQS